MVYHLRRRTNPFLNKHLSINFLKVFLPLFTFSDTDYITDNYLSVAGWSVLHLMRGQWKSSFKLPLLLVYTLHKHNFFLFHPLPLPFRLSGDESRWWPDDSLRDWFGENLPLHVYSSFHSFRKQRFSSSSDRRTTTTTGVLFFPYTLKVVS